MVTELIAFFGITVVFALGVFYILVDAQTKIKIEHIKSDTIKYQINKSLEEENIRDKNAMAYKKFSMEM